MIIRNWLDLNTALTELQSADIVAIDTETTGLNVRKDKVIGISFSTNSETGYYIPRYEWNTEKQELIYLQTDNLIADALSVLKNKKTIFHNAYFDIEMIRNNFGMDLKDSLYLDTILLKHTVDEEHPFGLKEIAKSLWGEDAAEEQKLMKESIKANGGTTNEFYKADLALMAEYAVKDTCLTFKVYEHYIHQLERENLWDFFFKEEVMPLFKNVTFQLQQHGIPLDMPLLTSYLKEIDADIEKLEEQIQELLKPDMEPFEQWYLNLHYPPRRSGTFAQYVAQRSGVELPKTKSGNLSLTQKNLEPHKDNHYINFLLGGPYLSDEEVKSIQLEMHSDSGEKYMMNLSSKHHIKKIVFEFYGLKAHSHTQKGSPQVNDSFLEAMAEEYEWIKLLQVYNKLQKIKGSYLERLMNKQEDGIFYPSFFQHRTTSSRYGSDAQQLPRPIEKQDEDKYHPLVVKYNNVIRKLLISGKGYKFIGADYASLEVQVFADDAGDEALIEMARKGDDFYSTVAISVNDLKDASADKKADNYLGKINKSLRQFAKTYSLGIRYGLAAFKLSKDLGISQEKAEGIIKRYFESYPKLKTRMEELKTQACEKGYVVSKSGRKRRMPLLKKLHSTYGPVLSDGLELWKRYNAVPKKYEQVKYLSKQYRSMINNAYNFPIQSMAAHIVNQAAIELAKELEKYPGSYICLQVHDELILRVPDEYVEPVSKAMKQIMENTVTLSVPLNADPEVGENLLEIK